MATETKNKATKHKKQAVAAIARFLGTSISSHLPSVQLDFWWKFLKIRENVAGVRFRGTRES